MGIYRVTEGADWFSPGQDLLKQGHGFTAGRGMKYVYLFCQGGDKKVPVLGAFVCDVFLPGNKGGKKEESAKLLDGVDFLPPFGLIYVHDLRSFSNMFKFATEVLDT
jgi:hypothetical protein